jgi:hypothetical protein
MYLFYNLKSAKYSEQYHYNHYSFAAILSQMLDPDLKLLVRKFHLKHIWFIVKKVMFGSVGLS